MTELTLYEIADEKQIVRKMHGMSAHPVYKTWKRMIRRCYSPTEQHFNYYGGRGIRVCKRWMNPLLFIADMSDGFGRGLSLDRINPNGHYAPDNCRWATHQVQSINKRNVRFIEYGGERIDLPGAARNHGLHPETVAIRLKKGATIEDALNKKAQTNPHPRRVFVDGTEYPSLTAAGAAIGITRTAIYLRLKRGKASYIDG